MTAGLEDDVQLEIGHVLFMDVVGFSKLLVDEQTAASRRLNEIVRNTEQFRAAESAGKLMRLPTGDGMVLVFFSGPEAPARCAIQIAERLKNESFGLRMGIHSGPINKVSDVNDRSNVAGTGINIAQRVMDCGDAGHILVSKRVAEDLEQHSRWRPIVHDLGELEVKHGVKIGIASVYSNDVGNPAVPAKLKEKQLERGTGASWQRKLLIAAGAIALVAGSALYLYRHSESGAPPLAMVFPGKSIAVLPFKPLVAAKGDEVLEAGMADTLIAKLSSSRELVVPSLMAVRKYDDDKRDSAATGKALRVNCVLEGSVQKAGDRIRVTARLIKTADGTSMWSGSFDQKFTDVFAVQDSIAEKVAAALAIPLNEAEHEQLTKRYTDNAEAYQLYLKGRFYWNKYTAEGFQKSVEFFKQALEKDPNYALAYSGLADSYSLLGEMAYLPAKETFPQARAHAEKALSLDERLSSAHLSLGIVQLFFEWNFPEAAKNLVRAKELDPNNVQIYHFYGHYLELVGRLDEAIAETKRGVALDPTNVIVNAELAFAYYYNHLPDDAVAQAHKALELDPTFSYASCIAAWGFEQKGMFAEARTEIDRARSLSASDWSWLVGEIGAIEALTGNRPAAENTIDNLRKRTGEYVDPILIAYIYIALHDNDQAFAWMEKGFQDRSGMIGWIQREPKFNPIRSDPRFAELEHRMGLR